MATASIVRWLTHKRESLPSLTLRYWNAIGHYCLVEAIPETGRTHQIRAHLYALGLSIVGDKLYGKRDSPSSRAECTPVTSDNDPVIGLAESMGLHALSLEIKPPADRGKDEIHRSLSRAY